MDTRGNEAMQAPMFDGHAVLLERATKAQGGAQAESATVEDLKATARERSKRASSSTPTASFPLPTQGGATKKMDHRSTPTWIPHASAHVQPASLPSSQESGVTGSDISQWIGETQRNFASRLLHKPAGSGDAMSAATSATSSSSSGSRWGNRTCPATPPQNAGSAAGDMRRESPHQPTPPLTPPLAAAVAAVAAAAKGLPSSSSCFAMPAVQHHQQRQQPSARGCAAPPLFPPAAVGVGGGGSGGIAGPVWEPPATAAPPAAQPSRQASAMRQGNPSQKTKAQARQGSGSAGAGALVRVQAASSSSERSIVVSAAGAGAPAPAAIPLRRKAAARANSSVAAAMVAAAAAAAAAAGDDESSAGPSSRGEKGAKGKGQGRPLSLTRNGAIKGPWTKEEDAIIVALYEAGVRKWAEIAEQIPGRVGKQCRERWFNHLDPAVKKTVWMPEEDRILVTAQHSFGNSWTKIAKLLPGRSENAVKNRWNSAARRKAKAEADIPFARGSNGNGLSHAAFGSGFDAHARWLNSDTSSSVPTEDATAAVLAAAAAVEAREAQEKEAEERYAALSPEEQALVPKPEAATGHRRKLPRGRKNAPAAALRRRGAAHSSSPPQQRGVTVIAVRRRPPDADDDAGAGDRDGAAASAAWAHGGSLPPPLTRPASAPQLPGPPTRPAILGGGRSDARAFGLDAAAAPAAAGRSAQQHPGKLAKARQLSNSRQQQEQQERAMAMEPEDAVVGGYGGIFDEFCGGAAMAESAGALPLALGEDMEDLGISHSHHHVAMPVPMQMGSYLDTSCGAAAVPRFLSSPPLVGMGGISGSSPRGGDSHYFLHDHDHEHEPLGVSEGVAVLPSHLMPLAGFGGAGGVGAPALASNGPAAAAAYRAAGGGTGMAVSFSAAAAAAAAAPGSGADVGGSRAAAAVSRQMNGVCDSDADGSELLCSSVTQDSAEDEDPLIAMNLSMDFSAMHMAAGTLTHGVGGGGGGGGGSGGDMGRDITPSEMALALNQLGMCNLGSSMDGGGVDQYFYDSAGGGSMNASTANMLHSFNMAAHAQSMHSGGSGREEIN